MKLLVPARLSKTAAAHVARGLLAFVIGAALFSIGHARATQPDIEQPAVGWRGDGSGRYSSATPPDRWSADDQAVVAWATEVGGGYSSPVAVGQQVFIMSEPDLLYCMNSENGEVLWKQATSLADLPNGAELMKREPPKTSCGYTTPTPVCNGGCIYVALGTGLVACYDTQGQRRWLKHFDPAITPSYGRTASPLVVGGKLLVYMGHLRALNIESGETMWEVAEALETTPTPVATTVGDTQVLVTAAGEAVRIADGRLLASGFGQTQIASPICHEDVVWFVGPLTTAFRLEHAGKDELKPNKLWSLDLSGNDFQASPVFDDGLIYAVSGKARLIVLDAETGKRVYEHELDPLTPGEPAADVYPSLSLAGGQLFVVNNKGHCWAILPGRKFQDPVKSTVNEGGSATPTFLGAQAFVRSGNRLLCLRKSDQSSVVSRQ